MPKCPECGTDVDEQQIFCSECGHSLKDVPRTTVSFLGLLKEGLQILNPFASPPKLLKPTDVVYQKLPPYSPLKKFLGIGLALGVVGMLLIYGGSWLTFLGISLLAFTAPLLFFIWMWRNDRFEGEPLSLIVFVIGWGVFSGLIATILNIYLVLPLMGAAGAAFVEEPLKAIGIYWLARHKKLGAEFNDHMDGIIYGAGAGAGFAWMEDVGYIMAEGTPDFSVAAVRGVTAFGHLVFTGLVGRVLGIAKTKHGYLRITDILAALPVGVILHFTWNALPGIASTLILSPLYLFIFYRTIKAASRDEELWGYRIRAPVEKS